jgi:hypothetical protein
MGTALARDAADLTAVPMAIYSVNRRRRSRIFAMPRRRAVIPRMAEPRAVDADGVGRRPR